MNEVKKQLTIFCKKIVEIYTLGSGIIFVILIAGSFCAFLIQLFSFIKTGDWSLSLAKFLIGLSNDLHYQNAMIENLTFDFPKLKGIEKILNWIIALNASVSLVLIAVIWILCTSLLYKILFDICEQK